MTNPFKIFKIKKEERFFAMIALLLFIFLNALTICSHWNIYTMGAHGGFWTIFTKHFLMSGYDCWTWIMVSGMRIHFTTIRHPLYLSFLYPLYLLNHWLIGVTGVNFAVFMVAAVLVFSAFYAAIFTYRILREILCMSRNDSMLLVALLFSFANVMLPVMVPDHFIISMMLLTMTIYIAGKKMMKRCSLDNWQSLLLIFFTSGIAASNGVKIMLADWFVNGKKVFRPKFILVGIVFPLIALLAIQQYQYRTFEVPQQAVIAKIEKKNAAKMSVKDKQELGDHHKWVLAHRMKSPGDGLLTLFDFKTPRVPVLVEDYFGESFLFHKDYALGDVNVNRPMAVAYHAWWCYGIELCIVFLFIAGAWLGRKNKLMQMLLCWFSFDVFLNFILGFAVNEIYIMTSGWAFIIPVAIAFILKSLPEKYHFPLESLLFFLTLFLWCYNTGIIIHHLY